MTHDHMIELLDLDVEVLHEYFQEVIGWVAGEAPDRPHVVDLGAGSGTGSLALARRLPGATVTAVDIAEEMLDHLRHRADAAGLTERIRTVQADLDQAWPDLGPVDVIWAASAMHHMAEPAKALGSAFGALRPGGLLVIAELQSFPHFLAGTPDEDLESRCHTESAKRRHEAGLHMHENWGDRMRHTGFTSVAERHFDIDLRPPLPAAAARYARVSLGRTRQGLQERLSPADLTALDTVIAGLAGRDDLSVRTERTVWLARR